MNDRPTKDRVDEIANKIVDGKRLTDADSIMLLRELRMLRKETRAALATIARVEGLFVDWRERRRNAHGSVFADGVANTLHDCADELERVLRGDP